MYRDWRWRRNRFADNPPSEEIATAVVTATPESTQNEQRIPKDQVDAIFTEFKPAVDAGMTQSELGDRLIAGVSEDKAKLKEVRAIREADLAEPMV
jgi:hypothetical protein